MKRERIVSGAPQNLYESCCLEKTVLDYNKKCNFPAIKTPKIVLKYLRIYKKKKNIYKPHVSNFATICT